MTRKLGCTQALLRFPIVLLVGLILGVELLLYVLLRLWVLIYEGARDCCRCRSAERRARKLMRDAATFDEWCAGARLLDAAQQRDAWRAEPKSPYYDHELIQGLIEEMAALRRAGDVRGLSHTLLTIFSRENVGGFANEELYQETHFGTKLLISDFLQAVTEATILVRDSEQIPLDERRNFFVAACKAYGRTALLLSGGAAMGYMHLGLIRALLEAKCLPSVMGGASAGSLMSAFVCCRTDEELKGAIGPELADIFKPSDEPWRIKGRRLLTKGYLFDVQRWITKTRVVTKGDTTFAEAYALTGRALNIATTSTSKYVPSMLLNYKSTPNVVIWSAILASSAFPRIIEPVELVAKDKDGKLVPFHLHGKKWSDGTIKMDVPIKEVGKFFDARFTIVHQVNPHLMPFFYNNRGSAGRPSPHRSGSGMRGGFVSALLEKFLKLDMIKWLHFLGQMDLLPLVFGVDWRYIFTQEVGGTVTIVPDFTFGNYWRIISDPSRSDMKQYIRQGERAAWSKLARISNHYRFEKLLSDCRALLDSQAAGRAADGKPVISAAQIDRQRRESEVKRVLETKVQVQDRHADARDGGRAVMEIDRGEPMSPPLEPLLPPSAASSAASTALAASQQQAAQQVPIA